MDRVKTKTRVIKTAESVTGDRTVQYRQCFAFVNQLINSDVRNAPETNSAMTDVMNDEHVTSDVA